MESKRLVNAMCIRKTSTYIDILHGSTQLTIYIHMRKSKIMCLFFFVRQTTYHLQFLDQAPLISFLYHRWKQFQHFQHIHHRILVHDYHQNQMYVMHMQLNVHNELVQELKLLLNNEHLYGKANKKNNNEIFFERII